MGMMVVSDDEFNNEVLQITAKPDKPSQALVDSIPTVAAQDKLTEALAIIEPLNRGRGIGNNELPESLRKIIGESAITESNDEVARAFDVSPSSVSAYKNGATSTASYNKPSIELDGHIVDAKERITKKARGKLMMALRHITTEKLADAKVRDVAGIAKEMSAIIKNLTPPAEESLKNNNVGPQFIFYAPPIKKEDEYEIIHIK